jgi:hypothetical protein
MRKLYILLFLVFVGNTLMAQDEMFKSLFIYNFTKNIEWPTEYTTGDFIITVVGNSPIVPELEKIAKLKKVGSQPIVIQKVNEESEIGKCHLIYITPSKSNLLAGILTKTTGKPVVVIGDNAGMAGQGAGFNFIKVDGKQKFEISIVNLEKNKLQVNSYLATLGIVVE